MAINFKQEGEVINFTNGVTAVVSGQPVAVGMRQMGIALVNIAISGIGSVALEGIFSLTKTSGVIVDGQKLWWDATNKYILNAPALGSYFIGYAYGGALTGATSCEVALAPFVEEGPRLLTLAATGNQTISAADLMAGHLNLIVPNTAAKTLAIDPIANIPPGTRLLVRKTTTDAYAITLDPNSTEQIGGGTTFATIDAQNDFALFASTGTAWQLVHSTIA